MTSNFSVSLFFLFIQDCIVVGMNINWTGERSFRLLKHHFLKTMTKWKWVWRESGFEAKVHFKFKVHYGNFQFIQVSKTVYYFCLVIKSTLKNPACCLKIPKHITKFYHRLTVWCVYDKSYTLYHFRFFFRFCSCSKCGPFVNNLICL